MWRAHIATVNESLVASLYANIPTGNPTYRTILEAAVAALFPAGEAPEGQLLTNDRQVEAAERAAAALRGAREALEGGLTPDAVLSDAERALSALGELTGRTLREDLTARIFERFCVGK